jgi:S-DNA-T family DNA segregation ATPase FtsK/SpoIIIE
MTQERLTTRLAELGAPSVLEQTIVGSRRTQYRFRTMSKIRAKALERTRADLAFAIGDLSLDLVVGTGPDAFVVEVESDAQLVRLAHLEPAVEPLSFPLGVMIDGKTVYCDIPSSPHILIGGETGAGKTTAEHAMLCALLRRFGPEDLLLLLIDPKQVEFSFYDGLPHLLAPVVKTPQDAYHRLGQLIEMMELRYTVLDQFGARNLVELNQKLEAAGIQRYPYVLCVVDELADLMMSDRKRCESLIVRLAQKARAVGIHLVLATQSPRVTVVSGLIKVNTPTRIAFSVSSMTDSRVLLDRNGAQALLGRGDGLYSPGGARPVRFQAAWVDSAEITTICDRWRR